MKRFFVDKDNFNNNLITIDGVEHNHLKNVLRLSVNERIVVVCGDEFDYQCEIIDSSKSKTICKIVDKTKNIANPQKGITFFQALTKKDNMNLIVQKLTELGVKNFVPFENRFITAKTSENKQDKLQTISNQSIKQCGRSIPMNIHSTISFDNLLKEIGLFEIVIFANEKEKNVRLSDIKLDWEKVSNVAIIVGSEGGFSDDEIAKLKTMKNITSVTFGNRILRAETASISLASFVSFMVNN